MSKEENLETVTKLVMKLADYDQPSYLKELKELLENLLNFEKHGYYESMQEKLVSDHMNSQNTLILANNFNSYRKIFLNDILLVYLDFITNSRIAMETNHKTVFKYYRKAIEYALATQMFLTSSNRTDDDNLDDIWSKIDQTRKYIGKAAGWKYDNSNNLKDFFSSVHSLTNEFKRESHPDSKQIFYSCLQILIQASGAYCSLVEPSLITGKESTRNSIILISPDAGQLFNPTQKLQTLRLFGCTAEELLQITIETERILENQSLSGSDWLKRIKNKWSPERLCFYTVAKADYFFQQKQYMEGLNTLQMLYDFYNEKNFHGFSETKSAFQRRIDSYKFIIAEELKKYDIIPSKIPDNLLQEGVMYADSYGQIGLDYISRLKYLEITSGNLDNKPGKSEIIIMCLQLFQNESGISETHLLKIRHMLDEILLKNQDFDFIKVVKNLRSPDILAEVHDARIRWKRKYSESAKETFMTEWKAKNKRRKIIPQPDEEMLQPPDEDEYKQVLEIAIANMNEKADPSFEKSLQNFLLEIKS